MKGWQLTIVPIAVAIASSAMGSVPTSAFANLEQLLAQQQWQIASDLTWKILNPRGESTSDLDPISCTAIDSIDRLWTIYSNGRYGFSIQWQMWQEITEAELSVSEDSEIWTEFDDRVGWYLSSEDAIASATPGYFPVSEWWLTGEILTFGCGDADCTIPRTTVEETIPAWTVVRSRWEECQSLRSH